MTLWLLGGLPSMTPEFRKVSLLVLLGVLARCITIVVLQSPFIPRSTYEHGEIAANLLAGRGFSTEFLGAFGPTSQQAPVYPLLVAGAFALGGVETPLALWILQLGQALMGGALVLGVYQLARQVVPERLRVATFAAAFTAGYPTLVYAATHVQSTAVSTTLVVWLLVAAGRARLKSGIGPRLITGLILGTLVLTDPILVLAALALGLILFQRQTPWRAVRAICVVGALAGVVVSPWLVRNFVVHREFVFVKSTFGYAFWQGNCLLSQGTDKVVRASVDDIVSQVPQGLREQNQVLWKARHEAGYIDDIALTRVDKQALGRVSEPQRSRLLMRRALDDLSAHPGRYLQLCVTRLRSFLLFDETNPKTRTLYYRVPHTALSVFAVIGLLLAGPALWPSLLPGLVLVVSVAVFHTFTIVSARFHIPIEPLLILWSAIGVDQMLLVARRLSCRNRGSRPATTLGTQPRLPTVSYSSGSKAGFALREP